MELLEGIIIKTMNYKDDSKIIYLMTQEGFFSAIGKGSLKIISKNFYLLQELTKVAVDLKINSNSFNIIKTSKMIDNYSLIKNDLGKIKEVLEILEITSVFGEHITDYKICYKFLNQILDKIKLCKNTFIYKLMFKIKFLYLLGVAPVLSYCTECGAKYDLMGFDIESGGMKCKLCYNEKNLLNNEVFFDFKKLYTTKLNELNEDTIINDPIQCDLFIDIYYEKYLGYKIKTSNIFKKIKI